MDANVANAIGDDEESKGFGDVGIGALDEQALRVHAHPGIWMFEGFDQIAGGSIDQWRNIELLRVFMLDAPYSAKRWLAR